MKKYSWIAPLLLFAAACGPDLVFESNSVKNYLEIDPAEYDSKRLKGGVSDEYELENAEVEGDTIFLNVWYGGGCGEVSFTLLLDELVTSDTSSLPTLASLLMLDDRDDCEAGINESLPFPLSELPDGPYTLYVYNPSVSGQVVLVDIP
ncbi:MAG TPA: hypothetical protein DCE41_28610 [Cytophagales bacterium]|nr:hypothetical protein [Cytophagales bacterium]HAA17584.1 hypothetical protein [Cytophagales bacterium]HAP62513.1 hypothetical protein [Cytophagales bacterium]